MSSSGTTDARSGEHPKDADLGFLVVHGIGLQREGKVVGEVGGAFLRWLQSRMPGGSDSVSVRSARLRPKAAGGNGAAEVRLALTPADPSDPERVILFRECLWVDEFYPPAPLVVLRWILGPGVWILLNHILDALAQTVRRIGLDRIADTDLRRVVRAFVGVLLVFFLIFPLQILGALLWLLWLGLSMIPIQAVRDGVRRLFLVISDIIGDSYAFASDPLARAAVVRRVKSDLDALEKSADKVVVLAHSQGAAVAFEALGRRAEPPALVTYGAGIRKLEELDVVRHEASLVPGMASLFPIMACLWFWGGWHVIEDLSRLAAMVPGEPLEPVRRYAVAATVMFVVYMLCWGMLFMAETRVRDLDSRLCERMKDLLARGARWLDLWSSADPVPGGPLLVTAARRQRPDHVLDECPDLPGFATARVVNEASTASDHNAYWRSYDDFMDRLVGWLRSDCRIDWLPEPPAVDGRWPSRRWRVSYRLAGGLMLIVTALVVFIVLAPQWRPWLLEMQEAWLSDDLPAGSPPVLLDVARSIVAFLGHLGAALVYRAFVLDPLWASLDRRFALRFPTTRQGWLDAALRFLVSLALLLLPLEAARRAIAAGSYAPLLTTPVDVLEAVHAFIWPY